MTAGSTHLDSDPAATIDERRVVARWLGGILAVAAVVRLLAMAAWARTPLFVSLSGDESLFHTTALRIVAGSASTAAHFYQPLYGIFLSLLYRLLGPDPVMVRIVHLALGLVAVLLAFGLGREVGGARVGLVSAALASLYGPEVFFELQLLSPALTYPLTMLALWLIVRSCRGGAAAVLGLAGLALGVAILARPNLAIVLPVAAIHWWRSAGSRSRGLTGMALAIAGLSLAILPVWLHNAGAGEAAAAVSTSAGANFFLGNNPRANGRFHVPSGESINAETHETFEQSLASAAEHAEGRPLSAGEVSRHWLRRGLDFWREQPASALRLFVFKLRLGLARSEITNHFGYAAVADFVPALRHLAGFGLILPLAVLGALLARELPDVGYLAAWASAYLLGMALFFVADGYRLLLVPPLLPLAAAGLVRGVELVRRPDPRRLTLAVVAFGAGAALTWPDEVGEAARNGDRSALWNQIGIAETRRGRPGPAESAFRRSIEVTGGGGGGPARANLAAIYESEGKVDEARQLYRQAITAWPELRAAYVSLARLEERAGNPEVAVRVWRALAAISADPEPAALEIRRLEEEGTRPASRPPEER